MFLLYQSQQQAILLLLVQGVQEVLILTVVQEEELQGLIQLLQGQLQ